MHNKIITLIIIAIALAAVYNFSSIVTASLEPPLVREAIEQYHDVGASMQVDITPVLQHHVERGQSKQEILNYFQDLGFEIIDISETDRERYSAVRWTRGSFSRLSFMSYTIIINITIVDERLDSFDGEIKLNHL